MEALSYDRVRCCGHRHSGHLRHLGITTAGAVWPRQFFCGRNNLTPNDDTMYNIEKRGWPACQNGKKLLREIRSLSRELRFDEL